VDEAVEGLLATERGLVVAAAGCGKTELIARTVANPEAGRQLVLTHTHAGVAALKNRLDRLKVPTSRYHLDTIAGWSLKYAAAYSDISGLNEYNEAAPEWNAVYPAARLVLASGLGHHIVSASYDGVLVDEYQDCSASQHAIVKSLAEVLPVRVVGDPLQAIFGFRRDDPMVDWSDVEAFFKRLPDLLMPHRWKKENANAQLGAWLIEARTELIETGRLTIRKTAPVEWTNWSSMKEIDVCRRWRGSRGVVAIKRSTMPNVHVKSSCLSVATRLSGCFQMVEAFDDKELPRMVATWPTVSGGFVVRSLHEFVKTRMVRVGPALNNVVAAVADGRSTARFTKHLNHRDRLEDLATNPTPETALSVLEGFRKEPGWTVYRPEGIYQLRSALQESEGLGMSHIAAAVASVRTRARHRGRHVPWRTVGTTLLLKGLEFDDAIVLNADELSRNELYVAITRGARSLHVLSADRTIQRG